MQIHKNEKGFVSDYALIGTLVDGLEVPEPADLEHFEGHFEAYTVKNGELVYDDQEDAALQEQVAISDLRTRREKECFSVINRGQLWYSMLTKTQAAELATWYQTWLTVTDTKVVPERPAWL